MLLMMLLVRNERVVFGVRDVAGDTCLCDCVVKLPLFLFGVVAIASSVSVVIL